MSALVPDREDHERPSMAALSKTAKSATMNISTAAAPIASDLRRVLPLLVTIAGGAAALFFATHGFAQEAAQAVAPAAAAAPATPPPPVPNKGDVAWMLTSTALVLLMSVPALALFYGGLVRTKNMLS